MNHTYLDLQQARKLASSLIVRYMEADELLDRERDAQAPEYYHAAERYQAFLDGASFAFRERSTDLIEHDLLDCLCQYGPRPRRGEGRTDWTGHMIDGLTLRWGVKFVTQP
jgi:hypothetical protein